MKDLMYRERLAPGVGLTGYRLALDAGPLSLVPGTWLKYPDNRREIRMGSGCGSRHDRREMPQSTRADPEGGRGVLVLIAESSLPGLQARPRLAHEFGHGNRFDGDRVPR